MAAGDYVSAYEAKLAAQCLGVKPRLRRRGGEKAKSENRKAKRGEK
jgi:hypothetical protein